MSSLEIALYSLLVAFIGQVVAFTQALGAASRPGQPRRAAWLLLALAWLLLGLEQGHAFELAWTSGLHDLSQAVLGALGGLAAVAACALLRRPS